MADLLTVQLRHALAAQPRLAERIDLSRPDPDPASLLPCPFCGGKPEIIGGSGEYRAISCQSCSASCDEVVQDGRAEANWSRRVAAPPRPKAIVIMPAKHSEAGIHAFQQNVEATAYWVRWAHCGAEIHTDCNYTWHSATPKKETSSVAVIATRSGEPCPTCCSTNTVRYTPDCYRCLDCGNTFSDHEEDDTDD